MGVLLNGIDDIEGAFGLDVACLRTLSECNAVHDVVRLVVHQFQLDVFLFTSYHLTCTVIIYIVCTEYRLGVVWSKRIELLQVVVELVRNVFEKTLERQANRLSTDPDLDMDELTRITLVDLPFDEF